LGAVCFVLLDDDEDEDDDDDLLSRKEGGLMMLVLPVIAPDVICRGEQPLLLTLTNSSILVCNLRKAIHYLPDK